MKSNSVPTILFAHRTTLLDLDETKTYSHTKYALYFLSRFNCTCSVWEMSFGYDTKTGTMLRTMNNLTLTIQKLRN